MPGSIYGAEATCAQAQNEENSRSRGREADKNLLCSAGRETFSLLRRGGHRDNECFGGRRLRDGNFSRAVGDFPFCSWSRKVNIV